MNGAVAGRLERWQKCQDRQCECGDLADDRKRRCGRAPRVGETKNDQRSRERRRGNQPKAGDDPTHATITSSVTRLRVAPAQPAIRCRTRPRRQRGKVEALESWLRRKLKR